MNKLYIQKIMWLCLLASFLFPSIVFSQTSIKGKVTNSLDSSPLAGVSIQVKGKVIGTSTKGDGTFSFSVNSEPPFNLLISSLGFETQEIPITKSSESLLIALDEKSIMGDEVVVSASRIPESLLQSPVSIERLNTRDIQASPQPTFYDALLNIKGVEMTTQSLTFRSISTRGFGANGNNRMVQLIDGMDNQAPGLNFAVGNVVGMSELDVENVELLPGAASALYGPNAINGLLLMNSKSPFDYQGVSAYVKTGMMSASNRTKPNSAYHDVAFRLAKSYNNRVAFKVNVAYLTANDWQATDYRDQSFRNGATLDNNDNNNLMNPYYDGVNWYGDVGANVYDILRANGKPGDGSEGSSGALGAIFSTPIEQLNGMTLPQLLGGPTLQGQMEAANNIFNAITPQHYFNAPGYSEQELTKYPAKSLKLNGSLHYRITDDMEAIFQANWGKGSAVYTAADRYNIENFTMGQYKAELRGDNFFVRGYTTRENSGDAHALGVLGSLMSQRYIQTAIGIGAPNFVQSAFSQYAGALLNAYSSNMAGARISQEQALGAAYLSANAYAEANRDNWMLAALAPGVEAANKLYATDGTDFQSAMKDIKSKPIPSGAHFLDRSNMYHAEAMYDFKRLINPARIELLAGVNYRVYELNSEGTLFATKANGEEFNIKEYGAYVQGAKNFNDVFKLTASIRYDKNENFKGQFSPRISGVYTVANDHNIRASFQRGFRIPTTQNQYIDLLTPQARLIGGLPLFREKYNMINNPVFRLAGTSVEPFQFKEWEPERVETYEIGYKSLINKKLLVDMFYYYNRFLTFEGTAILVQKKNPDGSNEDLADPTKRNVYSMPVNAGHTVKNSGWGIGADYLIGSGYVLTGNVSQNILLNKDQLKKDDPSFITTFNSPEFRFNAGFSNRNVNQTGWGFGVTFRHQTEMEWNASIATVQANVLGATIIPAYTTLDAQVSKALPAFKSVVKLGATNIGNKLYTTGWGNPSVGGMYYLSIVFDELFN